MTWWSPERGVDVIVGVHVGHEEQVSLRLSREGGAYLTVGDVEIALAAGHVAALCEQGAAVLADIRALDDADSRLAEFGSAGEQAGTVVEYARSQADAAWALGLKREAQAVRAAADQAAHAVAVVTSTVRSARDAVEAAEHAVETAGQAAATARAAVTEAATASTA
ncbi:hypothetical protein ACTG9Q_03485 [Actinokineospora sp. 24-640]